MSVRRNGNEEEFQAQKLKLLTGLLERSGSATLDELGVVDCGTAADLVHGGEIHVAAWDRTHDVPRYAVADRAMAKAAVKHLAKLIEKRAAKREECKDAT